MLNRPLKQPPPVRPEDLYQDGQAFEVPDYAPTAWSAHVQAGYSLFARRIDKLQDCSEELRVMCSQLRKQHVSILAMLFINKKKKKIILTF